MSHYFESGFSVRVPMWHGLGVVVDDYPATPEEACALAKSDWLVEKSPLMVQRPFSDAERRDRAIELAWLATDNFKKGGFMRAATLDTNTLADALFARLIANVDTVPNAWAVTRSDTGAPLGVVTDKYELVQNIELYRFVHELVNSDEEEVKFETGGVLKGGRNVWALCRFPQRQLRIPNTDDLSELYVLVTTGHDGATPFQAIVTRVRVVCWNTLSMALGDHLAQYTVRHVGDPKARVEEAREALGLACEWSKEFDELALQLASMEMTDEDFVAYRDLMLPMPVTTVSERVMENALARRETFTNIYEGQAAPRREDGAVSNGDFAAIGHTRWAALNAATEYFDWHMGVNDTTGEGPLARRMCRSMLDNKLWFKRAAVDCLTQDDIPAYVSEALATN